MKKKHKNKASHAVLDFCFDLLAMHFDSIMGDAIKAAGGAMKDVLWAELKGLEDLREIFRLLQLHKTAMELQQSQPPPATRNLNRLASDTTDPQADEKRKERQEAWKQAQQARKKLVLMGTCRCSTKQELQNISRSRTCSTSLESRVSRTGYSSSARSCSGRLGSRLGAAQPSLTRQQMRCWLGWWRRRGLRT